jgi:hypothetical protein
LRWRLQRAEVQARLAPHHRDVLVQAGRLGGGTAVPVARVVRASFQQIALPERRQIPVVERLDRPLQQDVDDLAGVLVHLRFFAAVQRHRRSIDAVERIVLALVHAAVYLVGLAREPRVTRRQPERLVAAGE